MENAHGPNPLVVENGSVTDPNALRVALGRATALHWESVPLAARKRIASAVAGMLGHEGTAQIERDIAETSGLKAAADVKPFDPLTKPSKKPSFY